MYRLSFSASSTVTQLFLFQDWFSVPAVEGANLCSSGTEVVSAIPTWVYYSFFLGAIMSIGTILWSVLKTPEIPPSDEELKFIKERNKDHSLLHRIFEVAVEVKVVGVFHGLIGLSQGLANESRRKVEDIVD